MKKSLKKSLKKKYTLPAIAISLVILLGGVAILTGGVAKGSEINISFWDKVAQYAGQILGDNITKELKDSGALDVPMTFGAVAGTDHYQAERFWAGFSGGVNATSTSNTATTILERDLVKYNVWEVIPTVGSLTYTLPATSTLTSLMRDIGDSQTWIWENATTSTAITLTIAAGTGWNLSGVDANVDVFPGAAYTARELVIMECYRQANKDINCELRENIAAD